MPRPLFAPEKDPVPIVQEAGWAPGTVWTGAENLAPLPGFDPWTAQPVASHYTDSVAWPTIFVSPQIINSIFWHMINFLKKSNFLRKYRIFR
jgi:hypothetical protein